MWLEHTLSMPFLWVQHLTDCKRWEALSQSGTVTSATVLMSAQMLLSDQVTQALTDKLAHKEVETAWTHGRMLSHMHAQVKSQSPSLMPVSIVYTLSTNLAADRCLSGQFLGYGDPAEANLEADPSPGHARS